MYVYITQFVKTFFLTFFFTLSIVFRTVVVHPSSPYGTFKAVLHTYPRQNYIQDVCKCIGRVSKGINCFPTVFSGIFYTTRPTRWHDYRVKSMLVHGGSASFSYQTHFEFRLFSALSLRLLFFVI